MSKLSHSNPDLDDVYTGEEELEKMSKMSDEKVTKEQVAMFVGRDNKLDVYIDELLDTIASVANGEYEPKQLREDIFSSDFG
jgi:cell fate (sporulation/competence/biofilm development) regulator YlbF (YheA/YmcA/DUF963 family)